MPADAPPDGPDGRARPAGRRRRRRADGLDDDALDALCALPGPARAARIEAVLDGRTRDLAVVLENLHDPHNLSAVLRTADAFGVQEVHVVDRTGDFEAARKITQGAHKWLDLHVGACISDVIGPLRARGFRCLAATLAPGALALAGADLTGRVALVFGNERDGLSADLEAACDGAFVIPMRGFARALNVSVAAAISLHHARTVRPWPGLADDDRAALRRHFLAQSVRQADRIAAALAGDRDGRGANTPADTPADTP